MNETTEQQAKLLKFLQSQTSYCKNEFVQEHNVFNIKIGNCNYGFKFENSENSENSNLLSKLTFYIGGEYLGVIKFERNVSYVISTISINLQTISNEEYSIFSSLFVTCFSNLHHPYYKYAQCILDISGFTNDMNIALLAETMKSYTGKIDVLKISNTFLELPVEFLNLVSDVKELEVQNSIYVGDTLKKLHPFFPTLEKFQGAKVVAGHDLYNRT